MSLEEAAPVVIGNFDLLASLKVSSLEELVLVVTSNGLNTVSALYENLSPVFKHAFPFEAFMKAVKKLMEKGVLFLIGESVVLEKAENFEKSFFGGFKDELVKSFGVEAIDFLSSVDNSKTLKEIAEENLLSKDAASKIVAYCFKNKILKPRI